MTLRIALVTGEYPPMEGGVGAFTQEIGRELAELGHEIHVITDRSTRPKTPRPTQTESPTIGQALERVSTLREPHVIPIGQLHPNMRTWSWRDIRHLVDLTERYDFDIINIQYQAAAYSMINPAINFAPGRLSPLSKVFVTFHDLKTPYLFPKAGGWREWVVWRMARRSAGAIVTNTADELKLIEKAGDQTEIRNIPIGSNIAVHDINHFEEEEVREDVGLEEGDVLLAFFGFINETKGADLLIEALTRLPKRFKVVFIGGKTGASDPTNNRVSANRVANLIEAYQLQSRVHWTGFLSPRRVSAFLKTADLVVMPYRDGVSLRRGTLMAALAHGRPVISTHPARPISELEHGNPLWLVPPNEIEPLVEAIKALMENPELRITLGERAQKASAEFEWSKIAKRTAEFFESGGE